MTSPMPKNQPNYDLRPEIPAPDAHAEDCWSGWEAVAGKIGEALGGNRHTLAVECYTGVFDQALQEWLVRSLRPGLVIHTKTLFKAAEEIERLVEPYLGGDDPVFGFLSRLRMEDFLDRERLSKIRTRIRAAASKRVLIIGPGASLVTDADILIYADMPRWEGQLRQRRGEADNLGIQNRGSKASLQYKRSFFIDWRVCDRLKRQTMPRWDFLLDTTDPQVPKLITGQAHAAALRHAVTRPFRVVPFFDPGPWGGQWLRSAFGLPQDPPNFAWGFDCVPDENSLLLRFAAASVEIPATNLVFAEPLPLLGEAVYGRFGAEFPIRFDLLDTMSGGNLSFQVHPLTEYAREHFGISYTQDESYYLLDAAPGAEVYLGAKNGVRPQDMLLALESAQSGKEPFDDAKYAARFPAKAHDHFLIPAGTLHCSGAGCMVLEISATPYIFTFKLWDWSRLGLDGLPRPMNIVRGAANIQWDRDEDYARQHLINQFREVARGDGWSEERTGLHEAEFIETRRHWFCKPVTHRRTGGVEVLNLVKGRAARIESPNGSFAPMEVHFAETFILPSAAGDYIIRPLPEGSPCATIKAFVRTRP